MSPLICLRGIRKYYGGHDGSPQVDVLKSINLEIHAGEFVAIVGASGSGKSTLMNILGCLDHPSGGTYHFKGNDIASLDADQLAHLRREAFGFVFQGYHLIATESARENVEIPAIYAGLPEAERRARASALLIRLGLGDKQDNRPAQLSGGQQQRVSIARALMNGGQIILADEPTGALDKHNGTEVMALLSELASAGHTIILITHDRDIANHARRVIEISDGEICSDSGSDFQEDRNDSVAPSASASLITPSKNRIESSSPGLWQQFPDIIRTAWRTLWLNRFRTGLTLLGIIIGVASVIVMLAIGEGAKQKIMAQMGTLGTTIMYMMPTFPPEGGPRGVLTREDMEAIGELPDVRHVLPIIGDPLTVQHGNIHRNIYVFSSLASMPVIHHWKVATGRFFTDVEDQSRTPVVVLGHKAYRDLFPHSGNVNNVLGKQILISSTPFEVIGIMTERGADSGVESYDDMVFIPYLTGRVRVYTTQTQPDYTVVEAISSTRVNEAEAAILALIKQRHGRADVEVSNAAARLQAESNTRNTMSLMLSLVAAVSLVVGGIGVMNVMLMTVRERSCEIGIRMATGARQSDIMRQFLTEAVLVTLVGGGAGIAIGLLIGCLLLLWSTPLVFSVTAMLTAFSCAVATGLVFGYMPARTAARLDPVLALTGQ